MVFVKNQGLPEFCSVASISSVSVSCRPKLANSSEDIFFEAFVLLLISLIQLCGINVHLPLLQDFCLLKCFSSDYGIGNILLELLQFLRIQPFKKFICSYFMRQVFLFMFPLKKYTGFLLHFRHWIFSLSPAYLKVRRYICNRLFQVWFLQNNQYSNQR